MAAGNERSSAGGNAWERQVVLTHVFDAPRELVFKAWTEPDHMMRWWGPHGFTNTGCEMDVRPGGAWRIVMRSPEGVEHPCRGVYREVVEPERLVFTNIAVDQDDNPLIEGLTTVTFTEHGAKTKLTLRTGATGVAARSASMLEGMEQGWTQSLERLAERIAKETTSAADREIVTTRVFDAPRELVFEAWTDPKRLAQWWGPNGFSSTIHEMDVRPGGVWRLTMHGPDGVDYKNESVFTEVVKPERLAYTHVSPKFYATVTLEKHGGGTKLTLRMLFEAVAEHDRVVKRYGAIAGAKQTLARLQGHLARMQPVAGWQ